MGATQAELKPARPGATRPQSSGSRQQLLAPSHSGSPQPPPCRVTSVLAAVASALPRVTIAALRSRRRSPCIPGLWSPRRDAEGSAGHLAGPVTIKTKVSSAFTTLVAQLSRCQRNGRTVSSGRAVRARLDACKNAPSASVDARAPAGEHAAAVMANSDEVALCGSCWAYSVFR